MLPAWSSPCSNRWGETWNEKVSFHSHHIHNYSYHPHPHHPHKRRPQSTWRGDRWQERVGFIYVQPYVGRDAPTPTICHHLSEKLDKPTRHADAEHIFIFVHIFAPMPLHLPSHLLVLRKINSNFCLPCVPCQMSLYPVGFLASLPFHPPSAAL